MYSRTDREVVVCLWAVALSVCTNFAWVLPTVPYMACQLGDSSAGWLHYAN